MIFIKLETDSCFIKIYIFNRSQVYSFGVVHVYTVQISIIVVLMLLYIAGIEIQLIEGYTKRMKYVRLRRGFMIHKYDCKAVSYNVS